MCTLPNVAPEKMLSQKESNLPTINFQVRTVSFREGTPQQKIKESSRKKSPCQGTCGTHFLSQAYHGIHISISPLQHPTRCAQQQALAAWSCFKRIAEFFFGCWRERCVFFLKAWEVFSFFPAGKFLG